MTLNFTRLILLACWFGAALFFGAVVAPAAFGVLRSFGLSNANEIAGSIVTRSLSVVNIAGFVIALLLLVTADPAAQFFEPREFHCRVHLPWRDRVGDGRGPLVDCRTNARIARGDGLADRSDCGRRSAPHRVQQLARLFG